MCAELGLSLTWDYVRTASVTLLLADVKELFERKDSICLIHPHGFYVVLLGRNETGEWRFHFWPKGGRTITGMPAFIHTHDRHVESRILQGKLTNILYDAVATRSGGQPLYEVSYGGDRYASSTLNFLRKTDTRIKAITKLRETMECGDTYHVERHTYHEAVVSDTVCDGHIGLYARTFTGHRYGGRVGWLPRDNLFQAGRAPRTLLRRSVCTMTKRRLPDTR